MHAHTGTDRITGRRSWAQRGPGPQRSSGVCPGLRPSKRGDSLMPAVVVRSFRTGPNRRRSLAHIHRAITQKLPLPTCRILTPNRPDGAQAQNDYEDAFDRSGQVPSRAFHVNALRLCEPPEHIRNQAVQRTILYGRTYGYGKSPLLRPSLWAEHRPTASDNP
jgi:hypothetical protein